MATLQYNSTSLSTILCRALTRCLLCNVPPAPTRCFEPISTFRFHINVHGERMTLTYSSAPVQDVHVVHVEEVIDFRFLCPYPHHPVARIF